MQALAPAPAQELAHAPVQALAPDLALALAQHVGGALPRALEPAELLPFRVKKKRKLKDLVCNFFITTHGEIVESSWSKCRLKLV